ncbi:hypothetical protein [Microbulbifer sediminum]|nr:hypothetical protein [Microbulbifer sediminum]
MGGLFGIRHFWIQGPRGLAACALAAQRTVRRNMALPIAAVIR